MRYILRAGIPAYPQAETSKRTLLIAAMLACTALAQGQTAPATTATETETEREEDVFVLSPFTVDATQDTGYQATQTLAGTRIRTNLAEVGSAISVLTKELITDVGGFNNETVLAYAVNTEVAGPRGNFSGANRTGIEGHITEGFTNPNGNTRVRGLTNADNTRDFFLSDVPWDGYNISRVDLQRGPNAILFGLGSPAGVVNASTNPATFQNKGSVEATFDEHGTQRYALDYNRNVIDRQLGVRISLLSNDQKFQQRPAFQHDRRGYGAIKYAPAMLNRNGILFEVSGNFEHGEIDSNRPRFVPPEDRITQFWRPVEQGGIGKRTFSRTDFFVEGSEPEDTYGNVTGGIFNSLEFTVNGNGVPQLQRLFPTAYGARNAAGEIITTTDSQGFGPYYGAGLQTVSGVQDWGGAAALPYAGAGAYRNETISDPSIFDFYNKLIDGPNKREWTNWNVYSVDLTNTFFDRMLGYNVTMFKQNLDQGLAGPLGWDSGALQIDINTQLPDGSANPNVGRAFVGGRTVDMGSHTRKSDREAYRGQIYGEYDFAKRHSGILPRILGSQRVTGVYSDERQETDQRSIQWANYDPATAALFGPRRQEGDWDIGQPTLRYYVSGDVRNLPSPSGVNATNLGMPFTDTTEISGPIRYFDNTWIAAPTVNAGDPWLNPEDPTNRVRTWLQAHNPANYRGWTTTNARYITMNSRNPVAGMSARDYLTPSASLTQFDVKSTVAVWQGAFWDRAIVGVYGYRKDKAHRYEHVTSARQRNGNEFGMADLRPSTYNYDNPNAVIDDLETTTRNWSVMLHINKLLGTRDVLPVNIRLYYNEGENFQPLAGRFDAFLQPLAPPQGNTTDKSIMISTKDDKYSLRVTKYETSITNANSTDAYFPTWTIEQYLGGQPWWQPGGIIRQFQTGELSFQDYANAGGDVARLQNSIIPAWMQFEKDLKAQFPGFVANWMGANTSWGTDNLTTYSNIATPAGVQVTEDSVSEGYELEFIANPTRNWRIAINGSKTEAMRTNAPGPSWSQIFNFINNAFQTTDAGLAPVWWPGNVAGLRGVGPYAIFYPEWIRVQALNGQQTGEVRKYRANLITNYTFDSGRLKGLGVGVGYRWEDKSVIAYAPKRNEDGTYTVNINDPYYAPSEDNLDLWFSYSRKLTKDLRWRIQLNLFNVGSKDKLVPITAGIDYTKLSTLTESPTEKVPMKPYAYSIRQGMSWQLSNTLEF